MRAVRIDRRTVLAGLAALPAESVVRAAQAQQRQRRIHALVVGINRYTGRVGQRDPHTGRFVRLIANPQLRGCINDARRIEAALRPMSFSLTVLIDGEASRAAIIDRWERMLGDARAGDLIIFTYSGHGGQEPERIRGSEPDGLDETFVLSDFDSERRPQNQERIFDNEIDVLISRAERAGVQVVMLADSCHAGTMTRSADRRAASALSVRTIHRYDVDGDLAAPLVAATNQAQAERSNVLFLAGAQDNEEVPEIMIDGRPHGALSVAFADALTGLADLDGDRRLTVAELASYVLRSVRARADSAQHPDVRFPTAGIRAGLQARTVLFDMTHSATVRPTASLATTFVPGDGLVRLHALGADGPSRLPAGLRGIVHVPSNEAEVFWHPETGDIMTQIGSIIAHGMRDDLQIGVDRALAVREIIGMVVRSGLDMRILLPGERRDAPPSRASDAVHRVGTRLQIVVSSLRHPQLVVFNLTGNGTIQLLRPSERHRETVAVDPTQSIEFAVAVTPHGPFGADHVIAVAAAQGLEELVSHIRALDGRQDPQGALAAVRRAVASVPSQVGIQGLFTGR